VGGMAKALRTIPVILKIAEDMRVLAPGAMLVNFTNPSGLVTQALSKYAPDVTAVGVCNVAITTKMTIIDELERATGKQIDPAQVPLDQIRRLSLFQNDQIDAAYRTKYRRQHQQPHREP